MNRDDRNSPVPVAIIGMGCLFPGAGDIRRYWANIRDGVDSIREVPPTHWNPADYHDDDPKSPDRTYARRGGFLDPVDFPALEFGIAPSNLDATDTTQLLGLMVAKAALDDAGYGVGGRPIDRERVSVLLGVTGTLELVIPLGARLGHPIWRRALKEAGVDDPVASEVVRRISDSYVGWQENSFPGLLGNVAAGRIANRLDLGGTNCVVDAACASSLGAVHLAIMELAAGRCDVALSGGLDTFNDIFMYMCFSKTPALSPTGDARPFSDLGDGTTLGEGLGVLTLKRLEDARRDGDRVYAIIRGVGASSDGRGNAVYAPSASGQARCLRRAYESAGISPDTVELVEAHGTGTKVGDAVELSALAEVYRSSKAEGTWCALGSVKSQIGHTKAAAGAAGLIKAALALNRKVLPPTIKVERPAEAVRPGASPFYVNTEARPWLPNPDHPRRAAVSAFGFGGSNFHCVLEEADTEPAGVAWDGDVQILAYAGRSRAEIRAALDAVSAEPSWGSLRAEAARSREAFRADLPHRLVLVAERDGVTLSKLHERARAMLDGSEGRAASPDGVYLGDGAQTGGLAVLFPGQGSQYVGMLRGLACDFPEMLRSLASACEAGPIKGRGLGDWIYPHPSFDEESRSRAEAALRLTEVAQPSIGAVSLGAYRVLEGFGVRPDAMAGHSFGELTALCAAGRIAERDFSSTARLRGHLMAGDGGDRGAMLAALAPIEAIEATLREEGLDLVVANRNAPRQFILSGASSEVARAAEAFGRRGISTRPLDVSAAFHSRFVAGASEGLFGGLQAVDFAPGSVPVFANSTAEIYPEDPEQARMLLAGQLARPVRFVEQVEAMARSGIGTFLEVGPDGKLASLVDSILEGEPHVSMAVDSSKGKRGNLLDLARALAQLAAIGHPVELGHWDEGFSPVPTSAARPGLTVKVSGANFTPKLSQARTEPAFPNSKATNTPPVATPIPEPHPKMTPPPDLRPSPKAIETRSDRNGTSAPTSNGQVDARRPAPSPARVPASALAEAIRTSQENLVALQRMGEQTAHLHRQFLEGQDRTQQAFLALLEQQQRLTLAAIGHAPPHPVAPPPASRTTAPLAPPTRVAPLPAPRTTVAPAPPARIPAPGPRVEPTPRPTAKPKPPAPAPEVREAPRPEPVKAPEPAISRASAVHAVLVEVVSEKTGYPPDVLEPAMQLDADLGIDSIKRVEILSALQERLPEAPVIGPEHLGTIRTLGQIAEFLAGGGVESSAEAVKPAVSSKGVGLAEVHAVLVEVVSEKTGYPPDVLEPAMQLDADLGIDSIKRVEILSALQERLPEAPVIGPEHLGTIRTLGQIAEFLAGEEAPVVVAPESRQTGDVDAPAPRPSPAGRETTDPSPRLTTISNIHPSPSMGEDRPARPSRDEQAVGSVRRLVPTVVPLEAADLREPFPLPADAEVWVFDDGTDLASSVIGSLEGVGLRGRLVSPSELASLSGPDRLAGLVIPSTGPASDDSTVLAAFRLLRLAAPALRRAKGSLATVTRLGGGLRAHWIPGRCRPGFGRPGWPGEDGGSRVARGQLQGDRRRPRTIIGRSGIRNCGGTVTPGTD